MPRAHKSPSHGKWCRLGLDAERRLIHAGMAMMFFSVAKVSKNISGLFMLPSFQTIVYGRL
jgi:hypothetical protein